MSLGTAVKRKAGPLALTLGATSALLVGQGAIAPATAQAHISCTVQQHQHWYSMYTWFPTRGGDWVHWHTQNDAGDPFKYQGKAWCPL